MTITSFVPGEACYVFAGPSIDAATISTHFAGTILPPVGRGDLDSLLTLSPRKVGIIDGRFLHSLAVTPKEVLRALDAGVQIFGSSSMGAIRAAECSPFGMVGVGQVYQMYATGVTDRDDEVAMSYDPESGRAVSVAMVNIRAAMKHAAATGRVSPLTARRVIEVAEALWFPQRSWSSIGALLASELGGHELDDYRSYVSGPDLYDLKRADALLLLEAMGEEPDCHQARA